MYLQNWTRLVLLAFAAAASVMLVLRNSPDAATKPSTARLGIGYYMTDAELIVTGEDGQTLYRVRTESATQNPDAGSISLDKVFVEYDPLAEVPWELRADTGHIPPDRNTIELRGDVIAQTRDDEDVAIKIRTDFLELDTDNYIARTEHKVAIDYSQNRVFATGMRAFLKQDRLELLNDVNGTFAPETVDFE
jgi:lipopolysaccharide export system protein LptC